jgi:outer membrane protein assembly factor BamB
LARSENYDILYINTGNKGIVAVRLDTYELLWNFETGESLVYTSPYLGKGSKTIEGTPLIEKDCIYFGASDGYLYCLNSHTGALNYKIQAGAPIFTAIIKSDDDFFAFDFCGRLGNYNLK